MFKLFSKKESKMAKKEEVVKEVAPITIVEAEATTPREMWAAAVKERQETPQWSCKDTHVPVYKWRITVLLNEEPEFNDNVFNVGEKLDVSVEVGDNTDKANKSVRVPGVGINFLMPGGKSSYQVTDADGDVDFVPNVRGRWQFIVDEIGIAPWFNVV